MCAVIAAVLFTLFGSLARVEDLSTRLYWADEVVTSLRVAGYTMGDIKGRLFDGRRYTVSEIAAYQTPRHQATPTRIVRSLAIEDAQHPPLYYLAERGWVAIFGNSIAARRSLSTFFSVLGLPAIAWLALEIFASPLVASVAVSLLALSPLLEIYARQAREYALWDLLAICSAAAVARAARLGGAWWALASLSLIMTAYTFLFGIFSTLSAWTYVAVSERFRWTRRLREMTVVAALTVLCFAPWISAMIVHRDRILDANAWSSTAWPPLYLLAKLLLNLASPFYDLPLLDFHAIIVALPLFAILPASLWYLFRRAPQRARILVATLCWPTLLFVVMPDVVTHTHRSSVTRYLFPFYIALQMAIAYFIAGLLQTRLLFGSLVAVIVFSLEVGATAMQMRSDLWWDNQSAWPVSQIAAHMRAHPHALVATEPWLWPVMLELLPYLDPRTPVFLGMVQPRAFPATEYVITPSEAMLTKFRNEGFTVRRLSLSSPFHRSAHEVGTAAIGKREQQAKIDQLTFFEVSRRMAPIRRGAPR
jgi:uncharacterized membrane protein